MINITINGEKLDFKLENEKTVGEVMGLVEEFCNSQKNAVFSIFNNGIEVNHSEIDDFFNYSVDEDLNIELFTKSGEDIKQDIKRIGEEFITTSKELEEVSMKVQTGDDVFAIDIIRHFSNSFALLCRYLSLYEISGISVNTKLGEKSVEEYQQDISEMLNEVTTALEEKDIVAIGDITEYELSPLVKEFGEGLSLL